MSDLKINGSGTLSDALARDAVAIQETLAPQTEVPVETATENTTDISVNQNGELQQTDATITEAVAETKEPEEQIFDFDSPLFKDSEKTEPDAATQTPSAITWQDALKTVDRKELLKYLDIDDFAIEMNEHIKKGGAPVDYLNAKAVDWNSVPDTDLIIGEMKKEFPDATPTQLQRLFNKKYSQTDLSDDDDKDDGLLLMKSDARKLRATKVSEQSNFKIAEPKQVQQAAQPEISKEQLEKRERFNKIFQEHEATKHLINNKRVTVNLGEGLKPFSYNVDPQEVFNIMYDPEHNAKYGLTKTGEPDVQQTLEAVLFRMNPAKFKQDLINYGKSLGEKKVVEEGQNIQKPGQQTRPLTTTTDLKTLFQTNAKTGTLAGKLG